MEKISEHIWVLFIAVTIINALSSKAKAKEHIAEDPTLKEGYDKYFMGHIFFGNIPWVIVGIGNLSGMTNNMFEYFNPKTMNPIVLIFHASIIVLWILGIYWIYFNKGAEFIEQHREFFKYKDKDGIKNITAKQVKRYFPIMLLVGISAMVMMWVTGLPAPNFKNKKNNACKKWKHLAKPPQVIM